MSSRPLVLGHRGAPHQARENTVASLLAALDEGADGVEIDVQPTADGALALFHDRRAGDVPVHHLTLQQLRETGPVDTLDDALAALPPSAWLFVEVKRQHSAAEIGLLERLVALLRARERTWLGSFDPWVAERTHGVRRGWIVDAESLGPRDPPPLDVDVVSMEQTLARGPFLDRVSAPQTLAWPVDTDDDLSACFALFPRLGGVITKRPARARALWGSR